MIPLSICVIVGSVVGVQMLLHSQKQDEQIQQLQGEVRSLRRQIDPTGEARR